MAAKEAAIQQPLLTNSFTNKLVCMATTGTTTEEWCVLCGLCRDVISRTVSGCQSVENREYLVAGEGECPPLEATTGQWLVKT
jgi:hypothetical protein